MALCITVIARVASIPLWMRSKPWAGFFSNSYLCFCGPWSSLALYQTMLETLFSNLIASAFIYQTRFVITFIRTLMMKCIYELYVICGMYIESCTILVVVNHLSRPVVVLDGLPGLYGFKYDNATACGPHCTYALINWSVLRHWQKKVAPPLEAPLMEVSPQESSSSRANRGGQPPLR